MNRPASPAVELVGAGRPRNRRAHLVTTNGPKGPFKALTGVVALVIFGGVISASPPARGAFPGANGRIAFVALGPEGTEEIFTIDADGRNRIQLTHDSSSDEPAYSADGSKIVFTSRRTGNAEIFVMDVDGTNQVQLTHAIGRDQFPSFSPDGSKIVFISERIGSLDVYVMDADGSNVTRLTTGAGAFTPVFSPDGTKIAFSSGYLSTNPGNELYIMNVDGSNLTQITNNRNNDYEPNFSPDGTKIAVSRNYDDPVTYEYDYEIFVMNVDGSDEVQTTHNSGWDVTPAFSPDGTKMAVLDFYGLDGLVVMNADGTGATLLVPDAIYGELDWQPISVPTPTTTSSTTSTTTSTTTTSTTVPIPTARADCRQGGWENRTTADGTPFANQGQCTNYFNGTRE